MMSRALKHHKRRTCIAICTCFLTACTFWEANRRADIEIFVTEFNYFENKLSNIEGTGVLTSNLRHGVSSAEFQADLKYALLTAQDTSPWILMLGFEANSGFYSIHYWNRLSGTEQWYSIAISSLDDEPSPRHLLNSVQAQSFVGRIAAEDCIGYSKQFLTHARTYFISVHKGDGYIRRFAVEAPSADHVNSTRSITYVDLGENSDGSIRTGTFTTKVKDEGDSCHKTLSEYVRAIESEDIHFIPQ